MAQIDDGTNPLALSDDDFLSQNAPPADPEPDPATIAADPGEEEEEESEADPNVNDKSDPADAGTGDDSGEPKADEPKPEAEGEGTGEKSDEGNSSEEESDEDKAKREADEAKAKADPAEPKADPKAGEPAKAADSDPAPKPAVPAAKPAVAAPITDIDAQSFYQKIMTPFNANGKKIELKSPEEAIQLMQMGANYTRKMQELQPHRKTLMMLQNNELTDPEQVSFLIDVAKGDPEAIKKLLKDTGIDPLDIDLTTDSEYTGGGNAVSDTEVKFRTTVDELKAANNGPETIAEVNNRWDKTSKDLLWESPEIMTVIHSQRENGIYDTIKDEMDRRITLGQIDASMPFLQAYKLVGDEMAKAVIGNNEDGQIREPDKQLDTPQPEVKAEPIATKIAAPKPKLDNDEAAKGLAPGRQSPNSQRGKINPLALSDDDFLKQMENRV